MKGLIFYYSNSGNTKIACSYISKLIDSIQWDIIDMTNNAKSDLDDYRIIGFAASTYYGGPPLLVRDFINSLPDQEDTPAFIFNTYGLISGKTLKLLGQWVSNRGFKIISAYSLQTPESYPPLISRGITSQSKPSPGQIVKFNNFINNLNKSIMRLNKGEKVKTMTVRVGLLNSMVPVSTAKKSKSDMGEIRVDDSLCNRCGICAKICPHGAITLEPLPYFSKDRCQNCWTCYNKCPEKAIYASTLRGTGHYPKPHDEFRKKLMK